MSKLPYYNHLKSSEDLHTTYAATRSGFITLALEKNRRAEPYIAQARALQEAASFAQMASDLPKIKGIEAGLLTAAGLSDKSLSYLSSADKTTAINGLIENFLEPSGEKFVEELVFRFLLTRGETLGDSMRNIGGILAQRKLTRAILSTLTIAGAKYRWQDSKTKKWIEVENGDSEIEFSPRGISWTFENKHRTIICNLKVPLVNNNVDICLFNSEHTNLEINQNESYLALVELKGGIDPAGADEHWKTARTALDRIHKAFSKCKLYPHTFFIGAAIEKNMAQEIWNQLESNILSNAANLTEENQIISLSRWLCNL